LFLPLSAASGLLRPHPCRSALARDLFLPLSAASGLLRQGFPTRVDIHLLPLIRVCHEILWFMANGGPGYKALRKGRYSQPEGIYFITTTTHRRVPWFSEFPLACTMSRHLALPGSLGDGRLLCWVVMPDHIHLLLQLATSPLACVMNRLKSRSAIRLNREIGQKGPLLDAWFL
jgi:REP element-mobilizing transposase RayT